VSVRNCVRTITVIFVAFREAGGAILNYDEVGPVM
jgi:hypothetical protein